jgi:hypothetical protein
MVITSIIIFNGGAAGDFLKAICVEQLLGPKHVLDGNGMIDFDHHHLKDVTESWYTNKNQLMIDYDKLCAVENTHYYHECYKSLANNLFYIDYPDHLQPLIFKLYVKKRYNNNLDSLIQQHQSTIPKQLQHVVTVNNIESMLNILWIKNLRNWRKTSGLTKINFEDMLSYDNLEKVVEKIIQQPLSNPAQLKTTYQNWIDNNPELVNFFCSPSEII